MVTPEEGPESGLLQWAHFPEAFLDLCSFIVPLLTLKVVIPSLTSHTLSLHSANMYNHRPTSPKARPCPDSGLQQGQTGKALALGVLTCKWGSPSVDTYEVCQLVKKKKSVVKRNKSGIEN